MFGGAAGAPAGVRVRNPAFDVTPAANIAAIITEAGVLRPPFGPAACVRLRRRGVPRRERRELLPCAP